MEKDLIIMTISTDDLHKKIKELIEVIPVQRLRKNTNRFSKKPKNQSSYNKKILKKLQKVYTEKT